MAPKKAVGTSGSKNKKEKVDQLKFFDTGGTKLTGENYNPSKWCLGDRDSYDNPFLMATLCFEKSYEIDVLIFKPKVCAVAFAIKDVWYLISDFTDITGFEGLANDCHELKYDSRYTTGGCPTRFSFFVLMDSIKGIHDSGKPASFRSLCVMLCETMRSDLILRAILHSLGSDKDVRRVVVLEETHVQVIQNWRDLTGLCLVYDLGFVWDPLDSYKFLGVKDAQECFEAQGLLMKLDEGFELYFERLRGLSKSVLRTKQRRPVEMKGFIGKDEWNTV